MAKKLLEKVFEAIPEEKERYEKMNKFNKIAYETGLHIFNIRKFCRENMLPNRYKESHY